MVAPLAPLLAVDCLAGCDGPDHDAHPDPFRLSPLSDLTEDVEKLPQPTRDDQQSADLPGPQELAAAQKLARSATPRDSWINSDSWLQANIWLFLPQFARRVLAPLLLELKMSLGIIWPLTAWLTQPGLSRLDDLWRAGGFPVPAPGISPTLPPIPDELWGRWRPMLPPAVLSGLQGWRTQARPQEQMEVETPGHCVVCDAAPSLASLSWAQCSRVCCPKC